MAQMDKAGDVRPSPAVMEQAPAPATPRQIAPSLDADAAAGALSNRLLVLGAGTAPGERTRITPTGRKIVVGTFSTHSREVSFSARQREWAGTEPVTVAWTDEAGSHLADLPRLGGMAERSGERWVAFLAPEPDPDAWQRHGLQAPAA